jgi:hypothetical protein
VLFAPAYDRGGGAAPYRSLRPDVVEGLVAWAERRGVVLGFHDDLRDRARRLSQALEQAPVVHLRRLGVTDHVVVDRVAAVMLSDLSARVVDFAPTRRPVVLLVDGATRAELLHDPALLPVRAVGAPADLPGALDEALDEVLHGPQATGAPADLRTRALSGVPDTRNAARLVRRVRQDYLGVRP